MKLALVICIVAGALSLASTAQAPEAPAAFTNPPASFRPSPFWSWNSALDDEELRWQVREFKDKGYGGYFMHPRVGLVTRYLSDDFFHKIGVCLEEGKKVGLESWLYDEDKWPSGFAGGLATADHPEFVAMGMGFRNIDASQVEKALANPETLALFDVSPGGARRISKSAENAEGQLIQFFARRYQKANWYNGEAYIDTLNPDAIAHFLELTFTEGYNPRFRISYGFAIPGVFTDEPNFQPSRGRDQTVFPWTPRFPDIFRAKRGYDLIEKLPLLIKPLAGFEQARYDFWRTAAEQFEEAYSKPYGEMMGKLGLKYTGHYLAEDTLSSQTNVGGSVMLQYVHQHIPGIDHLQRNVANPLTKKQASSVADQFGRERVLSEIFGVSGHTTTFEDLKWMADNHFVLGVNLLAPHLSLYAMAGDRKRDYPPTFSYHQPYWPYMTLINDYLGRAAYFTTRGTSQKDILLLEPLGSVWSYWTPMLSGRPQEVGEQERRFISSFDTLLRQHRDFDLGEELILERYGRVEDGQLRVGPAGWYRLVVLPPAYRWNESTARLLGEFLNSGGKVIFQGDQPSVVRQLLKHRNAFVAGDQPEELAAVLDRSFERDISITDAEGKEIGDILYRHRAEGTRHYFFLANMSREETHEATIKLPGLPTGEMWEWDLAGGRLRPGSLKHSFPPAGSFAFTVETSKLALRIGAKEADEKGWTVTVSRPFTFRREQPNTLVLDTCRYTLNGEPEAGPVPVWRVRQAAFRAADLGAYAGLQPWALEWKGIRPNKTARVTMRFEFESELDQPNTWLVVEKAGNFDIKVNGQPSGAADGWLWDKQFGKILIGNKVRRGTNRVELSTVYKPGAEIEDIFVVGDFATRKLGDTRYALVQEPAVLRPGNWVEQGYHFYSGNMVYLVPVRYRDGEKVVLRISRPDATGFVIRSAGRVVARLGWQPWEADITSALKTGENQIELVVLGSLQNTFGPLHNDRYLKSGNNWWFGPDAFTDTEHWTDTYYHAPYGFGGLELLYR